MKIIVNADDFGFSKGINQGIIRAFKEGIVTSATMMMNMPYVEHGFSLYKGNEDMGLGVHLNVTAGRPVSEFVPSLVNESGAFYYINEIEKYADKDDLYTEMKAQIDKFISFGYYPTHLDSHHYAGKFANIRDVIYILANEYRLPVRIDKEEYKEYAKLLGIKTVDHVISGFHGESANKEFFENQIIKFTSESIVEFVTHPGYMDEYGMGNTSYNVQREIEVNELIKLKYIIVFNNPNIELINYRDLKDFNL